MMFQHPSRFIFVHVPKCGGSSITEALTRAITARRLQDLKKKDLFRHWLPGGDRQHATLREYKKHYDLDDYFSFGIARNPWDRAVSQIAYLRKKGYHWLFSGKSFKEDLRTYCNTSLCVHLQNLNACQLDYLCDASGQVGVDFVGKFEFLGRDFRTACELIGLKEIPDLPHVNQSPRARSYHTYYDMESAEWVAKRFARDIEHFGYEFDGP